jgi:hypothetical protein
MYLVDNVYLISLSRQELKTIRQMIVNDSSMKTMRGTHPVKVACHDPVRNIFYVTLSDGRDYVMRQPRKIDRGDQRKAWNKISDESKRSYRRQQYVGTWLYDMNKRCKYPLYSGEFPGVLPLTVEVDETVVGFCDIFFKLGEGLPRFNVDPLDKCANCSIVALDKYRGMGVGHYYSVLSDFIAKHYGCKWILGRTRMRGGMRSIRAKDDWEIIATDGTWVDHRKRL